MQVHVDVLIG